MGDKEIWRAIAGTGGRYEVSSMGRVRSWAKGGQEHGPRILTAYPTSKGYPKVTLRLSSGSQRSAFVHRLVIETFRGAPPEGHQCAHLNGDRADARLVNLQWVTPSENSNHRWLHGTMPYGERSTTATLTEAEVGEIRRLAAEGAQWTTLATRFGVNERTIRRVVVGETWNGGEPVRPAVPFAHLPTASKYRGVTYDPRDGKWEAKIKKHGKRTRLGRFDSEEDAARAYDEAARRLHGADGTYNFPRPGENAALVAHTTRRRRIAA